MGSLPRSRSRQDAPNADPPRVLVPRRRLGTLPPGVPIEWEAAAAASRGGGGPRVAVLRWPMVETVVVWAAWPASSARPPSGALDDLFRPTPRSRRSPRPSARARSAVRRAPSPPPTASNPACVRPPRRRSRPPRFRRRRRPGRSAVRDVGGVRDRHAVEDGLPARHLARHNGRDLVVARHRSPSHSPGLAPTPAARSAGCETTDSAYL